MEKRFAQLDRGYQNDLRILRGPVTSKDETGRVRADNGEKPPWLGGPFETPRDPPPTSATPKKEGSLDAPGLEIKKIEMDNVLQRCDTIVSTLSRFELAPTLPRAFNWPAGGFAKTGQTQPAPTTAAPEALPRASQERAANRTMHKNEQNNVPSANVGAISSKKADAADDDVVKQAKQTLAKLDESRARHKQIMEQYLFSMFHH